MKSWPRRLMPWLKTLLLGLTMLCMLAQPVLAAAQELHEVEHLQAEATAGDYGVAVDEAAPKPGTLDGLLHAFDCCLHVGALPEPVLAWTSQRLQASPPRERSPAFTPAPPSRFLRPPIAA